jgi:hypothetical protein
MSATGTKWEICYGDPRFAAAAETAYYFQEDMNSHFTG